MLVAENRDEVLRQMLRSLRSSEECVSRIEDTLREMRRLIDEHSKIMAVRREEGRSVD